MKFVVFNIMTSISKAHFHLPGLFEFYDFYKVFLSLYHSHREYFYDWCDIESIYGAPADCLWGGGRIGFGENDAKKVHALLKEYGISSRLTFSNSLITKEHLSDRKCNQLLDLFDSSSDVKNGIIIYSDILMNYIKEKYDNYYFVSSTTKVITDIDQLTNELERQEFSYVVPDFRFNKSYDYFDKLPERARNKIELLCNECCYIHCNMRKACYENVSRKSLGIECEDHICQSPFASEGYVFSRAMESPAFVSVVDIKDIYLPMGINNFKIEGRSLGSALVLEFILYYMTKPDYQLKVREAIYLNHSLDIL